MLIPKGMYEAEIVDVEIATSKAGKPMLRIEFAINGYPLYFEHFSLQPQATWRLAKLLTTIGVELVVIQDSISIDTNEMLGGIVTVQIDWSEYNGRLYNKILAFYKLSLAPTPEEFITLTPLELLKKAFPDQDVESLLKILEGGIAA